MTNKKLNQKEFCELTREEQFKADIARKDELIENRDQMIIRKDIQIAISVATLLLIEIIHANKKKD